MSSQKKSDLFATKAKEALPAPAAPAAEPAPPPPGYEATDRDLPEVFHEQPAEPKGDRTFLDAKYTTAKLAHSLGLDLEKRELGLCAAILFTYWQDADDEKGRRQK
jgi:hypothetical protein